MGDGTRAEQLIDLKTRFESGSRLSLAQICANYGIHKKTARRDLTCLETTMNLQTEEVAGEKIWRLATRSRKVSITYTLADLTALLMGRRLFDFLQGTLLQESLDKVYRTIEAALGQSRDILGTRNLPKKIHLISEAPKQLAPKHTEILDECLTALLDQKLLSFNYNNTQGQRHRHTVEPLTLVAYRRGLYLLAQNPGTNERRIYALERIANGEWQRGTHFDYPLDFEPANYFRSALFMFPGKPKKIRLTFNAASWPFIRIRKFHHSQKVKRHKDGRVEVALRVPIHDELIYWILSYGANVVAEEPAELREKIRTALQDALAAYGQ